MHYCMNEFVGWNIWHGNKINECGKCGMKEKKGGCCKDEHKQIKISAEQNHNQLKSFAFEQFSTLIIPTYNYNFNFPKSILGAVIYPKANASPPRQSVPLYLSNCVFLI